MAREPLELDETHWERFVEFARIELESRDVEPWADLIRALRVRGDLGTEEATWLLTLYNTYDDLNSAWSFFRRWPTPQAWRDAPDRDDAAQYNCTQERRGLRGGRVLRRHETYLDLLGDWEQLPWTVLPLELEDPAEDFEHLTKHLRQVWGVGRQSAFEWAEFLGKVVDLPVDCGNAQLWESEGPRRAIQRLWGNPEPSRQWLDDRAQDSVRMLRAEGIPIKMVDFETVVCDFNVGRDGRYYPGRHLAAIVEEIEAVADPADRALLRSALDSFVPPEWQGIPPGIRADLLPVYRDTGVWPTTEMAVTPPPTKEDLI